MEKIHEKVDVVAVYDTTRKSNMPIKPMKIKWRGRVYLINKFDYYNKVRAGRELLHIFSVANDTMFFKLELNADTLSWQLLETYDAAGT